MLKFGMSLLTAAVLLGAVACDDGAADTAENAGRCQILCKNVIACTGGNDDDVTTCRKDCKNESVNDAYEAKVKECQQCVNNDNKCVEKALECADDCAGVIKL